MRKMLLFTLWLAGMLCQAQTVAIINDVRYLIEDDHAVVGRQNEELSGNVIIPSTINYDEKDYPVTAMVEPTRIDVIADGYVYTENGAFQNCQITGIELPASITVVTAGAFMNCYQLEKATLPDGLTQISAAAFANCTNLTDINIPATVTDLGSTTGQGYASFAFGNCEKLTAITIPAGVTVLGFGCFKDSGITELEIPVGVTELADYSLQMPALTKLTMNARDHRLLTYSGKLFGMGSDLVDVSAIDLFVPNGSRDVYNTYEPWMNFKSITQLEGEEVYIKSDQMHIEVNSVKYIIKGTQEDGYHAILNRQDASLSGEIVIPDKVPYEDTTYPLWSIMGPVSEENHSSGKFVAKGGAFQGTQVTKVTLPSIETIPAGTFADCEQLEEVVLADGTKYIGAACFANCKSLTSINLPASVTELGSDSEYGYHSYVFGKCESLKELVIPEAVKRLASGIFKRAGIEHLVIPAGVEQIDEYALDMKSLKTLTMKQPDKDKVAVNGMAFGDKPYNNKVDLIVPLGAAQEYREYYPWIDFRSVTDVNCAYLDLDAQEFSAPNGFFTHDAEGAFNFTKDAHNAWYKRDYLDGLLMEETTKIQFTTTTESAWVYLYVYAANNSLLKVDGEELKDISENQSGTYSYRRYDKLVGPGEHTITAGTFYEYEDVKYPAILFHVEVEDASAAERYEPKAITTRINGVRYVLNEKTETIDEKEVVTRTATIARQNKDLSGDVVIPEKVSYEVDKDDVREYTVTDMVKPTYEEAVTGGYYFTSDGAFHGCEITSISLPATLKKVEVGAFSACQNLTTVTLAEGIEVLGAACFSFCNSLTEITLPETITDLGSETTYGYQSFVFGGCSNLKKVNTPKKVTQIPEGCFRDSGLETFLIPANVNTLAPFCFATGCLREIKICHQTLTKESIAFTESNFDEANLKGMRLIVPEGKAELYLQFYPWKEFGAIVEYVDQGDEHQFNAYGVTYTEEVYGDDEEEAAEAPAMQPAQAPALTAKVGEIAESKVIGYTPSGVTLSLPEAVEKEGYVFMEWQENDKKIMPAADVKVKASMAVLGDANKDRKVSITDAVAIVNYILGNPSAKFNEKAANVNRDMDISISDAVGVVNIILNSVK